MTGRVVVCTGGNTGVGYESCRVLASRGATVILTARDQAKGEAAVERIRTEIPNARVEFAQLDLADFRSIAAFAEAYNRSDRPLHVLMENAGQMALPEKRATSNFAEAQVGINHFGHFYLEHLLHDRLVRSAPARVVVLASTAHKRGTVDWDNLEGEKSYGAFSAYGTSKLCNILFARQLAKRCAGTGVTVNAVHPGVINTELGRNSTLASLFYTLGTPFLKSVAQGAATQVYVACAPALAETTGEYFADCNIAASSDAAASDEHAASLWTVTERKVAAAAAAAGTPF